jgi:16S rRNA (guanine527-N7)-methyltransferase
LSINYTKLRLKTKDSSPNYLQIVTSDLTSLTVIKHPSNEKITGVVFSKLQLEQYSKYLELLSVWTNKVDLVSPASADILSKRHLVDCLAAWLLIKDELPDGAILDVGTGAGLPGIIWAIAEPKREFHLCEPREKRILFLNEVISQLQLKNISLQHTRIEDFLTKSNLKYACVSERALGGEELFFKNASRLLVESGKVVILGGPNWSEEETAKRFGFDVRCLSYKAYLNGPSRRLVVGIKCFT